jgi:amino acid adenylation domain-containing protein/non-ribosomal peptide synthase protein (TIGR01720 family)
MINKKLFHSIFLKIAHQYAERTAIEYQEIRLSYAELLERAMALAAELVERSCSRGQVVALFMEPSPAYVVALLATALAGAAFMPLDPRTPRRRLQRWCTHLEPACVLLTKAQRALWQAAVGEGLPVLDVEAKPYSGSWPGLISEPNDLAYLLWTSGSSGEPKAIAGQHKGLAHFLHWEIQEFGLTAECRVSQLAAPSFDVSLRDILVPLLTGGTLCIPSGAVRENGDALLDWLERTRIDTLHAVPSLFRLLTQIAEQRGYTHEHLPALRRILLAGEPLYAKDVIAWRALLGERIELVNLYGPSETTLAKAYHRIREIPPEPGAVIPVGQALPNTALFVLKGNRLCAPGEIGEIYIKTPFRSLGYYRDPVATRQSFMANPLTREAEDIVYRTGDLGRYRKDQQLEVLGRLDTQIKLNGIRIELGEVEQAVLRHPAIREAVVILHQPIPGSSALVCYYTLKDSKASANGQDLSHPKGFLDGEAFRAFLREWLPEAILPAFFLELKELPKNLHGKVDRRALPKPELLQISAEFHPPTTSTETRLSAIWQEVLGLPRIDVERPFLASGGDSLKAIRVISRIFREFGREISLRDFFRRPTLRTLAAHLDATGTSAWPPLVAMPPQADYRLSPAQRRMWALHRLNLDPAAYNLSEALLIRGPLDRAALRWALETLVERHESLRTVFSEQEGELRQRILPHIPLDFEFECLAAEAVSEATTRIERRLQEERHTVFDLTQGPLWRVRWFELPPQEGCPRQVFSIVLHHIICDGWSLQILTRELSTLYTTAIAGNAHSLPPLKWQYKDYAEWQHALLDSKVLQAQQRYWQDRLSGELPVLNLRTDFPRPALQTFAGATLHLAMETATTQALEDYAGQRNVSLFTLLAAVLNVLLFRHTGQTDLILGMPVAGRHDPRLENQVGLYVNTIVLRQTIEGPSSFVEFLESVKTRVLEALDHALYPFDQLLTELAIRRDLSRSPLFDVMLTLHNLEPAELQLGEAEISAFGPENHWDVSRFDLLFHFRRTTENHVERWVLDLNYNRDLFTESTVAALGRQYFVLLASALANEGLKLTELPLMDAPERNEILTQYRSILPPSVPEFTLTQCFEQCVERFGDRVALIAGDQALTYRDLNQQAEWLAQALHERFDLRPDTLVGLVTARNPGWIIALLGILKAGAAYLPLDPQLPKLRLQNMARQAHCRCLLYCAEPPAAFPEALAVTTLLAETSCPPPVNETRLTKDERHAHAFEEEESFNARGLPGIAWPTQASQGRLARHDVNQNDRSRQENLSDRREGPSPAPHELAYVIFTSGSTGEPSGVMLEHRGLANLIRSVIPIFELSSEDRVLQFAASSFDASLLEIFMALLSGAALVLPETDRGSDPDQFVRMLERQRVTVALLPPTYLRALDHHPLPTLRVLISGGEEARAEDAAFYAARKHFFNAYGPTEFSVCATLQRVMAGQNSRQPVPIGRPIAHCGAYVLAPDLTPLPAGVIGEIYLTGLGLARGYLGDPEKTAARFLPNPFIPGSLMYRTLDLGYRTEAGHLVFVGRRDEQVKMAGYRIEPGEIAAQLRRHPVLLDAAVVVSEPQSGLPELNAYVVFGPDVSDSIGERELRDFLAERLPAYLWPRSFTPLVEIPLTPAGKLDRGRLPIPSPASQALPRLTRAESLLAEAWRAVLGREPKPHDHFFESGGDSIQAIRLAARLREAGFKLEMRDVFRCPVFADLTLQIKTISRQISQQPVPGSVPLTPIQSWFFSQNPPHPQHFNQMVELVSSRRIDLMALEQTIKVLQDHHDALRLRYIQTVDGWRQQNAGLDYPVRMLQVDLRASTQPFDEQRAHADTVQSALNLSEGPLLRAICYQFPDEDRILLVAHHLAVDGVSWRILVEDLVRVHTAIRQDQPAELPAKTDAFKTYAEALRDYVTQGLPEQEAAYWRDLASKPHDQDPSGTWADALTLETILTPELTTQILSEAHRCYRTQPSDLFLAALALAFRWSLRRDELWVDLESHGRELPFEDLDISRTVGWFTVIYPHRLDLREIPLSPRQSLLDHAENLSSERLRERAAAHSIPLGPWIKKVKESLRRVPNHGLGHGLLCYGVHDLWAVAHEHPEQGEGLIGSEPAGVSSDPFPIRNGAELSFNYLGEFPTTTCQGDFTVHWQPTGMPISPSQPLSHGLALLGLTVSGRLHLSLSYDRRRYHQDEAQSLLNLFIVALTEIAEHCLQPEEVELTPADLTYRNLSSDEWDVLFAD